MWNKYLINNLVDKIGFKQSEVDKCVFYKGKVMYALYTDDSILAGPNKDKINQIIKLIQGTGLNITVEVTCKTS